MAQVAQRSDVAEIPTLANSIPAWELSSAVGEAEKGEGGKLHYMD